MTLKTTTLRDAICFALAMGTTSLALAQQPVAPPADERQDAETTELDRIEVTGTRIRQVDVETAQPVTFVTRDDIEKQGFQSVADILQNISATGTPPISRASPLSAGENAGGTFISLRNLGAARTLVLMNGRRLPISTSGLVDISKIPAAAVERIEVLKDGASSVYGSDAIAGVINIITRSNFEGASASAYFGQYSEGDGDITRGEAIMGFTGERGSLTAAAEWREEDVVRSADRPYSAFPRSDLHPTDNWTSVSQWGGFGAFFSQRAQFPNVVFNNPTPTNPNPTTQVTLRRGGDPRNRNDYVRQDTNTGGCVANTIASPGPQPCLPGSVTDKSNTNLQTDLRTPVKSKSLYVDGIWDLTENVRFRTNLLYNNRLSARTVAGYPMQAASFALSNGEQGVGMSAQSYYNPTNTPGGTPAAINNWFRRTWEVPRVSDGDSTDYMFMGAFEGTFETLDRVFDWDVSYLYNESRQVQSTYGNLNLANTRLAVGPSFLDTQPGATQGQVLCGTADNPATPANERSVIEGCVPWNPYVPFGVVGNGGLTGNTALQNYLFQEEHATGETSTEVLAANIAGTIFELPAGAFGFAAGLEQRKEKGEFVPDALAVTGGSTNLSSGPTQGGYDVREAYLELQIPILADLPFARELSVNVASRFSDFDTFGETTNNKFSLKWKPFDSLLIRATAADGFRAPTIADLFGGGSQTFSFYTDPCDIVFGSAANNLTTRANCASGIGGVGAVPNAATYRQLQQGFVPITTAPQQTPIAFTQGSNAALTPELSKSQNIGFVWSPTFAEGLNIALDWWKIRISETIVTDTPTNMLNDCYVLGIAERCVAPVDGLPGFTRDPVTGIPTVSFAQVNAGFRKVEGFDFDIAYRWKTANWGSFNASINSTYTSKDYFVTTDTPQYATSGVGIFPGFQTFRVRANGNLSWDMGPVGISWMTRYYSSMKEGCTYFTPQLPDTVANRPNRAPPVTEDHLECNEIVFAPTGAFIPGTDDPASALTRRRRVGSTTFNDVQIRINTPWDATVAFGANNVFEKVGPVMYSQPAANVSYYGGFDIGRFIYMKYTQRF
jgi:iron complex outermembrane recepter protein